MSTVDLRSLLSEPARIRALTQCIRAKIPPHDVADVVQSTLADALAASSPPSDESALNRWLTGIARHKVADYYRGHRRHEWIDGDLDKHDAPADGPAESTRDLLRWVDGELASDCNAPRTLEWMMREADGDCLESIAAENNLSAPAVRQRVSRLRRYLKERWALQVAAALALVVVVGVYASKQHRPTIEPEPTARVETAGLVAQKLRQSALADCRSAKWEPCREQLDRAKVLDPAGDSASAIVEARADIQNATQPAPVTAPSASEERLLPAGDSAKTLPLKKPITPAPLHSQSTKSSSDPSSMRSPSSAEKGKTQSTVSTLNQANSVQATKPAVKTQEKTSTDSAVLQQNSNVQSAKSNASKKAFSKGSSWDDFGTDKK